MGLTFEGGTIMEQSTQGHVAERAAEFFLSGMN